MSAPWPPLECPTCGEADPSEGGKRCGGHRHDPPPGGRTHCGNWAGYKTDHVGTGRCFKHSGSTRNGRKAAERAKAEEAVVVFGLPLDIEPHEALSLELARSAGHCAWLQELIASFEDKDQLKQFTLDKGIMWEKPAVWVELYERERKHFTEVAKACVQCGLMERMVRVQETHMEILARVVRGALADPAWGLTEEQRALGPQVMRRHLALTRHPDDRGDIPPAIG